MRIVATPLTSGPITPGLEAISGGYRYQKDPAWTPNDPRYRAGNPDRVLAGCVARTARRQERLTQFAGILSELGYHDIEHVPPAVVTIAGRRLGVAAKTARAYRTELKQQRQREREAAQAS